MRLRTSVLLVLATAAGLMALGPVDDAPAADQLGADSAVSIVIIEPAGPAGTDCPYRSPLS